VSQSLGEPPLGDIRPPSWVYIGISSYKLSFGAEVMGGQPKMPSILKAKSAKISIRRNAFRFTSAFAVEKWKCINCVELHVLLLTCLLASNVACAQTITYDTGSIHDLDPPAVQSTRTLEAINGADDMQPVVDLAERDILRKLARPVGRFTYATADGKLGHCTASLIAADLILTNHHCAKEAREGMLWMGYLVPRSMQGVSRYAVTLPASEENKGLDYAILQVEGNPGQTWGTVTLDAREPYDRQSLFIIHHPGGFAQRISLGRCRAHAPAHDGDDLLHVCDTTNGSSGAPIFDNGSRRVVALHYSAVDFQGLNAGKRMARLLEDSPTLRAIAKGETKVAVGIIPEGESPQAPACDGVQFAIAGGETICRKPGEGIAFKDCADCPEMVVVPAGSFLMGSPASEEGRDENEGPFRNTLIEKPFAVGKFEITFDQWQACVDGGGCSSHNDPDDKGWGKGRRPVINVLWNDIWNYINWINAKTRAEGKDFHYEMLTEYEWEYIARAGTTTRFFSGEGEEALCRYGNGADVSSTTTQLENTTCRDNHPDQTAPVGSYLPNAFGIHDTAGNVWEWMADCFAAEGAVAGTNSGAEMENTSCDRRSVRGGSWAVIPRALRSAYRAALPPDYRDDDVGFRIKRTITK